MVEATQLVAGDSTFLSSDGGISLVASAPLSRDANYFGISGGVNGFAIDDADGLAPPDERLALNIEAGHFLTGFAVRWTRGLIQISGFSEDPLGSVGSYDAGTGTWSHDQPWTAGATVSFSFENGNASLGRSLELTILDPSTPNPQLALVWISYAEVEGNDFPVPVIVDASRRGQTIESFGASAYWSFDPIETWPLPTKERMAHLLFSEVGGIGLSSFRFDFGGGDLDASGNPATGNQTVEPLTWRFPEAMKTSASAPFDWTRREGQQWFLRRARDYGISRLTLGSNSPPAWCTKNGRTFCDESVVTVGDTNLDPTKVGDYADYLCDVIEHFRDQEGIVFSEVSPINEPEYAWDSGAQEGCRYYDPADIRDLVTELHGQMVARGLADETGILLGDHGSIRTLNDGGYLPGLHGHPDMVGKLLPFVGYHSYWTDLEPDLNASLRADLFDAAAAIGKGTMQTEFCPLRAYGNGRDLSVEPAWYVFRVIHRDLTRANTAAWSWWRALSPADFKDGLLYTDFRSVSDTDPEVFDSKLLWMLGNFSRFVRPGYVRLDVLGPDDLSGLMFSAWESPDSDELVVVAGNASEVSQPIDLSATVAGGVKEWVPWLTDAGHSLERGVSISGTYEMPPRSFVTFVGKRGASPFRLRCVVRADEAFPVPGAAVNLVAEATWEDGVVRLRPHAGGDPLLLAGGDEWVMRPVDREPTGELSDGRYEICQRTGGGYLAIGGDEAMTSRPLEISDVAQTWLLETDLEGRKRLRHEPTGRVMTAEWTADRDRNGDGMRVALESSFALMPS